MFKLNLEKAEEPEIKLPTSVGSLKKREFQKNICFIHYTNDSDCVDHNKVWKILQEMGIPDHLTCLLRNLYAGQEATVRTGHETTDWFQIGKGVHQGCILSPCLFNLYSEYIMRKLRLWHLVPSFHGKYMGKQWKHWQTLFFCAPKSLHIVTAAMKLKDAWSWNKSYDQPRQHIKKQRRYFANKGPCSQSYGFSSSHVWMWELDYKCESRNIFLN